MTTFSELQHRDLFTIPGRFGQHYQKTGRASAWIYDTRTGRCVGVEYGVARGMEVIRKEFPLQDDDGNLIEEAP